MKTTDAPVVVVQKFNAPVDVVWNAITNVEDMQKWFFAELNEFKAEQNFETRFTIEFDGKAYAHIWKLVEVEPKKRIVYDWSYDGLPGRGFVAWDLKPCGSGSELTLTNSIGEDFPQNDPAFKRESCEGGWNYFINQQLKDYVD